MTRLLVLSILSTLVLSFPAISQDCPPGNVFINTQLQADNFPANFPDCTVLPGNLFIQGSVTDLSPLGNLQIVQGNVSIQSTTDLTSLAGLGGITSIGGNLTIGNNALLPSLQGLNGLVSIGGDLWVASSDLPSFSGLESLTTVGDEVNIQNAHQLQSFEGLETLIQVDGRFSCRWVDNLQSAAGLENLTTVGGQFAIGDAPMLTSVDEVASLTTVGGEFSITNCPMLTSINGFNALETVGSWFSVFGCDAVTNMDGFAALTNVDSSIFVGSDAFVSLTGFRNLQTAGGLSVDGPLTTLDLTALQTITKANLDIECYQLTDFIGGDNLVSVGGSLILGTGMTNLPDFPKLTTVGGMLLIHSRATLEVLDGFNNLTEIGIGQLGWGFDVFEHDKLTTINGFNKLTEVEGDFVISNCDILTTVTAFEELSTVGDSYVITQNASLTDCSPFCPFLRDGVADSKAVKWNGGDATSPCWNQNDVDQSCSFDVTLIDANPQFYPNTIDQKTDIRTLMIEDIMLFDAMREAVGADGITEVIIKIEVPEEGIAEFGQMPEGIEKPWGLETQTAGERHFIYLLYTAPQIFDPGEKTTSAFEDTVLSFKQPVELDFINQDEQRTSFSGHVTIVRPPVVLVHGTFDNPTDAWRTEATTPGGKTFEQALQDAGYLVSAVDYTATNGDIFSGSSSFTDNTMVVWENPGGIQEVLNFYRSDLKAAVTQADVIGHSMGGVLARVYASEHYNPDGYGRLDNFMEGDINRLITISSTHFGSHLGELQIEMQEASIFDIGILNWIINVVGHTILSYYTGSAASEAVMDQQPAPFGGEALDLIGATPVPAHAITSYVEPFKLKDPEHDPNEEYYDLYWYTELMMYLNAGIRELYMQKKLQLAEMGFETTTWNGEQTDHYRNLASAIVFIDIIDNAISEAGKLLSVLDGSFEPPSGAQLFHWAYNELGMGDIVDPEPFIFLFEAWTNPVGVVTNYVVDQVMPTEAQVREALEEKHYASIEGLRSYIFNNDANDAVVSLTSQTGKLDEVPGCEGCVSQIMNVLHGFAPRYAAVQEQVIACLESGMDLFNANGFPDPNGVLPMYYPPNELDLYDELVRGDDAICRSGMVPRHAKAYARVADREDAIIIVRPVNPDATPVIDAGAATKPMDVKPKSSNWGPQRGYLPQDQRYSKIWKLFTGAQRDEQIQKYNEKVTENLAGGITSTIQLQIEACGNPFWVYIDQNKREGANDDCAADEIVLVPLADPNMVCPWGRNLCKPGEVDFSTDDHVGPEDCAPLGPEHDLIPFGVMATPDPEGAEYMTADYDLLMIGFNQGPDLEYSEPGEVPFREGVGQLTPRQEGLIDKLNEEANHPGGNLTHHGPENQFNHSPYIDYPLTVFAPDDNPGASAGEILSISMGDEGFRDINLKKYVNQMRSMGYDLYDNPVAKGWRWHWNEDQRGFELEDDENLADYVQEMPTPENCNKVGNAGLRICDPFPVPDVSHDQPTSWLGRSPGPINVTPNPVTHTFARISWNYSVSVDGLVVLDSFGERKLSQPVAEGANQVNLPTTFLDPGIYTLIALPGGQSTRFVRL